MQGVAEGDMWNPVKANPVAAVVKRRGGKIHRRVQVAQFAAANVAPAAACVGFGLLPGRQVASRISQSVGAIVKAYVPCGTKRRLQWHGHLVSAKPVEA